MLEQTKTSTVLENLSASDENIPVDEKNFPDANFREWIINNVPGANKGVLTTASLETVDRITLTDLNIADFTGIEHFSFTRYFSSTGNKLAKSPSLWPSNLTTLNLTSAALSSLSAVPPNVEVLNLANNNLMSLPSLPTSLTSLDITSNQFISLLSVSTALQKLTANNNRLTALPPLPRTIQNISVNSNQLTALPNLPEGIQYVSANDNKLTTVPDLPDSLTSLIVSRNELTSVPSTLPKNLSVFSCSRNKITKLPKLPNTLSLLYCNNNALTTLPAFPDALKTLFCGNNPLSTLPMPPQMLETLSVPNATLSHMPPLPSSLTTFDCSENNLMELDLTNITEIHSFNGSQQHPSITLTGNRFDSYLCPIFLNKPTFKDPDVRYEDGELILPNDSISQADFSVETNQRGDLLSGTMAFSYKTTIPEGIYVNKTTFPDNVFRAWILANISGIYGTFIPMRVVKTIRSLNPSDETIADLTGLELFTELTSITCRNAQLSSFPKLPPKVIFADFSSNGITKLDTIPASLQSLSLAQNDIKTLPNLVSDLLFFNCAYNELASLSNLGTSLVEFNCSGNYLTALPNLPGSLASLNCASNSIINLDLANLGALRKFVGTRQFDSFTLRGTQADGYKTQVKLNNPTFDNPQITYSNGNIVSSSTSATQTKFTVDTHDGNKKLRGTLIFSYNDQTPQPGISVDKINFPDDNFRNWIVANVPGAQDHFLTYQEIARVRKMKPTNEGIVNLKGIAYFTSLEYLGCGYNQLASIPNLPNSLLSLDCTGNKLTELSPRGQSLPHDLEELHCAKNNLKVLSGLPSTLTALDCGGNQITQADLSYLKVLKSFTAQLQTPHLELATLDGSTYTAVISLNAPTFSEAPIVSYAKGVLTSTDPSIVETSFTVQTGLVAKLVSGTMSLAYNGILPPAQKN